MTSQTDDSSIKEELNEDENENADGEEEDDDDDPFSMAVKELSETNRQADEIARVSIMYFHLLSNFHIGYFSNVQFIHNHQSHHHFLNHNHFLIYL